MKRAFIRDVERDKVIPEGITLRAEELRKVLNLLACREIVAMPPGQSISRCLRRGTFIFLTGLMFLAAGCAASPKPVAKSISIPPNKIPMSYHTNIIKDTQENTNFRRVLFTGKNSQLVVMSIPPGGEVGAETHKYTEQTLFFLSGSGEGEFDGKKFLVGEGDVVVVVPGTEHNFKNTGKTDMKIYTVYAPPNHIDGRVHKTKADADADAADEAVGETPPLK